MTIAATRDINQNTGIEYIKKHTKHMLKGTLFTGIFQEKRLVEDLCSYRDVVTVCPEEDAFIQNLRAVKSKIDGNVLFRHWLGITEPHTVGAPVGYNLWVVLPMEVFGKYWYKVKTVEFLDKEIRLKLEIVRPYQRESTPVRNTSDSDNDNLSAILEEKKIQVKKNLEYFLKEMLTLSNVIESLKFIVVLLSTILAALFTILQYLLEWFLKFLRELSGLIKASTPIFINIINLLGSTVFGLYKLIFALFHDKPKPAPVYNNYITYDPQNLGLIDPKARYNKYFNNRIPYYPSITRGPTITPLD